MRIRLLNRSWTNATGRTYPIGEIIQTDKSLGLKLIVEGHEEYTGVYPLPKGRKYKMKTNLFKPK